MATRRSFLRDSTLAVAGAAAIPKSLRAQKSSVAPADQIRIGVIGCNGMGFADLSSMMRVPEVELVALCDIDDEVLNRRAVEVEEKWGATPVLYKDFRRVLDDPDIDAVIIGTPDHWHCLMMVMACEAGKDVYVEKPLANSIGECALMVAAAERYGRVVQVGQWQRSGDHWIAAMDYVQSGALGKIRLVKAWAYQGWMKSIPVRPDEAVPEGVDYDMWLGPAPARPYNRNRFHFSFRWFWDYAGGLMTDWGVHCIDMVHYGMNATAPNSVTANGGKFAYPGDAAETPDTLQAVYAFDDFSMLWEHATGIDLGPYQRDHGVAFVGNLGTLVADRSKWQIYSESEVVDGRQVYLTPLMPLQERDPEDDGLHGHTQNFVDCMKSREQPRCNAGIAAQAAVTSHMGNISYKTGRRLTWNEATGRFDGDAEANALLLPDYRSPWTLPSV